MPTIEMARVDNRLIHGQISVRWCSKLEINTIIVVNDAVAQNKVQQGLLDMAVPDEYHTRYCTLQQAIDKLPNLTSDKKMLLIFENIQDLRSLVAAGVKIPYINIGNLDMSPGKRHIAASTSLSQEEMDWLDSQAQAGTKVEVRRIPSEEATYVF
ncbi:PTS sugar transporter subunit IIB [uncultured Abiotrophia sp.]|uniref:PTS sugar transporter subunit IIB n=1 Tax=uncultured Abiotrophia sp. TaxID=316094 RepID=UPI00260671A1|nr:PTS sugar transporter subunit IIB [uncultured Abiotrophia sp.]